MADLLKPKPCTVTDRDGVEHQYIISRLDCWEGRRFAVMYPKTLLQTGTGDYKANEDLASELMAYVAVQRGDDVLRLSTKELVRNHVPDGQTLGKLEAAMAEYNYGFFDKDVASTFLKKYLPIIKPWVTSISMGLLARLSVPAKQP